MTFVATKKGVFNRGVPPDSFLREHINWGLTASEELFAPNANYDIYNKVYDELGPWKSPLHRRAVMLEVQRVLAGFESEWDFKEGVDTSRLGADTPENEEAGAWQVSYDARGLDPSLRTTLNAKGITNGIQFQRVIKSDHPFAMEFEALLLRIDVKDFRRLHNGPLYKGGERIAIRSKLRGAEQSIYPWLSRASVAEYQEFLFDGGRL